METDLVSPQSEAHTQLALGPPVETSNYAFAGYGKKSPKNASHYKRNDDTSSRSILKSAINETANLYIKQMLPSVRNQQALDVLNHKWII